MEVAGSNTSCLPCKNGTVAPQAGSRSCAECSSSVDFAPYEGACVCETCPDHAAATSQHSDCWCDVGYYAVSSLSLLQELDPDTYGSYMSYTQTTPFDANKELNFMSNGADCRRPGTTLSNVKSLEGYFPGTDQTGTAFFTCLNASCGDGTCNDG